MEKRPVVSGSPGRPVPGYDVAVLGADGEKVADGDIGALVVKLPLPPGNFTNLWNADKRFMTSYFEKFPGYYETGDSGYVDEDGHVFVMARTDDVINVAGHRLSTGAMEEVLAAHPDVAECAVFGVADQLKGQLPLGLVVLNSGVSREHDEIASECIAMVRNDIGPVAAFKLCGVVDRLPKTRSGKILRGTMRRIADKAEWTMPATIEDASALGGVTQALETLGYA
jgi:propionyl-CoA synthetase